MIKQHKFWISNYFTQFWILVLFVSGFLFCKTHGNEKEFSFVNLVASTPADPMVLAMLAMDVSIKADFIRWDLDLNSKSDQAGNFQLHLIYGRSQNDLGGFKEDSSKYYMKGSYTVSKGKCGYLSGKIYNLKSDDGLAKFLLIKINENLFHIILPNHAPIIGNNRWSYSLNNSHPAGKNSIEDLQLDLLTGTSSSDNKMSRFENYTPCREYSQKMKLAVEEDCVALHWRLILKKDSLSNKPTVFQLRRVNSVNKLIEGTWSIQEGCPKNKSALIYQLKSVPDGKVLTFLAIHESLLFILNERYELLIGNQEFSYTLNRNTKPLND